MCSQQSKGAKYPQKSFNCADAFSIKITRFHAALKPIFRSLKPFQAFSSLLNLGARDFSFYMNTYTPRAVAGMHDQFHPLSGPRPGRKRAEAHRYCGGPHGGPAPCDGRHARRIRRGRGGEAGLGQVKRNTSNGTVQILFD